MKTEYAIHEQGTDGKPFHGIAPVDPQDLGTKLAGIWHRLALLHDKVRIAGSTALVLRYGRERFGRIPADLDIALYPEYDQYGPMATEVVTDINGILGFGGTYLEGRFWDRMRWGETENTPKIDLLYPGWVYANSNLRAEINNLVVADVVDLLGCKFLAREQRQSAIDEQDIAFIRNQLSGKDVDAAWYKYRRFFLGLHVGPCEETR